MALKNIIYLSAENYTTLKETGTVTVGEQTITYSEDDVYCVPDETAEQIGDLQAEMAVQEAKITTVEESVKKYYRHDIEIYALLDEEDSDDFELYVSVVDSTSTAYDKDTLVESVMRNRYTQVNVVPSAGAGGVLIYDGVLDNKTILSLLGVWNDGYKARVDASFVYSSATVTDTVTEL